MRCLGVQVIQNEHIVAFDIDETIVHHIKDPTDDSLEILNPYSGSIIICQPIKQHVELMKQYKGRGLFVVVWSKAGSLWAETVIRELLLEDYVDLVMTKFDRFVDDLQADEVLGERVYIAD